MAEADQWRNTNPSKRLETQLERIAHEDLSFLGEIDYSLNIRNCGDTVVIVGEVDEPPYRFVRLWVSTVDALEQAELYGTGLRNRVAVSNITEDCADLLLGALGRVFGSS